MKNHKVRYNYNDRPYPMYFKSKAEGENIIFDVVHTEQIQIGDTFQAEDNPQASIFGIVKIDGSRKPKGKHPKGAVWCQITCSEIEYNHEIHAA